MDHFSFASILHDKENTQTKKILRESQTGVNSPRRTPLGNVRNKLPTNSYAFNIRKTLYGTPTSSTKWKSPLSSVSSKKVPVLSVSQDVITKPQSALKQHAGRSDKKKVVRFSLKNQLYSPVPLMKTTADNADDKLDKETEDKSEDNLNEVTQNITEDKLDEVDAEDKLDKDSKADEEDKLDKEIEGFISSILRHTVDEIRNEYQTPAINVIPPTPSPSIILHEDTPKTAEHIARQFKIEYAESDKSPVNGCLTQFKQEEEDPNKSSSSTSDFKLKSKIPVRSSPQCDHMQDESPSNYPRTPRVQLRKRQTSPNKVSYDCQQTEEIVVSVDNQSVLYNSPTAVSKCNTSPSKRRGLSISVVKSVSVPAVQQNVVEKACSPILLKTATTETNTDPIPVSVDASMTTDCYTPVKSDQHVQVKPESMSVALSPFCISSTDDSTKQETCDTSAMTDVVSFVSQGVMVKPVCVDTMTMTDFACKKTSETSMTPVKTLSKAGKRLTAEEVRRQHPRAIANQLDTTLVCNERLKSDLKVAEKERDRLKCIVKDLRASLSTKHKLIEELEVQKENEKTELEQMHFEVVRDFQTKIEEKDNRLMSMEQEVLDLKSLVLESEQEYKSFKSKLESQCGELQLRLESQEQQHLQQVQVMKADFESNNYKGQFERSQQMIQELQAQLDEFAGIMEDLEVTEHLQGEVHSAISETHKKLRHAGVKNAEMRKKLITEYVTMQKLKKELVTEVETHKQENQALREECESLVTSLEMSHDSITQLQSLYASTSSDLLQATSHVCQLNTELAGARKGSDSLQDFVLTKELLVQHLSDQKDKQEDLTRQLDTLSTQHCQKTQDLLEEQKRSQDWERLALEAKASLTEKCAEYELSITNLQRTLDYRDHDIDILEKDLYECREIIHEQRYQVGQMEEEFEAFKQKVHVQRVDQAELKALQDNAEFLEAERGMLIDTLRDSEEKIRSTFLQLNQQQKTLADTQVQFLEYQTTIQSLQEELSTSRLELHCTRQESQRTMLQQQGELEECREAVTGLEERMCTILGVLRMKVGVETEEDTVDAPAHSNISSESLVSKVLHAVNASIDTSEEKDASFSWSKSRPPSEEASPTEGSTSQARSSTDSGYNNSFASPGEASRSRLGFSQASAFVPVRSAPQSQSIEDEDKVQMPEDRDRVEMPNNDGRSHKSIVKQISVLSEVLSEIVSMANILEKASALSLQDLKGDNCLLREKVCWLEGEALRLQQDRVAKTEELTEANKLVEELKNRIRDMGDRIIALSDYQFENKKMHQDMMQLMGDVKRLEGEKEILEEQLAHPTPHRPGQVGNPGHSMQGQVISLKKKNQQLLIQLMEEKDRYQEMGSKAARKMKILEDNWKKAEAEVFRFDELVDSIQKILEDNREFISRNPELLLLMKVINGEDTIPSGGSLQPRASLSGPSLTRPIQRPSLAKMPKF